MHPATILFPSYEGDPLIYCERHSGVLREATIYCERKGGLMSMLGLTFGLTPTVILYPESLQRWEPPHDALPFTEEEKARVLRAIALIVSHQGYTVKFKLFGEGGFIDPPYG